MGYWALIQMKKGFRFIDISSYGFSVRKKKDGVILLLTQNEFFKYQDINTREQNKSRTNVSSDMKDNGVFTSEARVQLAKNITNESNERS